MILNTQIFKETVAAAKAAAASCPAWLRAIDRAVIEIERATYWTFAGGVLVLTSTTSHKTYTIDDAHTCEAKGPCKHKAARRLMQRYTERLTAAAPKVAPQPAPAPKLHTPAMTERERKSAPLVKREGNAMIIDGWTV